MVKRLLFLCTGNYYRSRFAEVFFNALAEQAGLAWQAESRGLALCAANVGPISPHAVARLAVHGLAPPQPLTDPRALQEADLAAADLIIAVSDAEHRPMLSDAFPAWAGRVRYWQVEDIGEMSVAEALAALEDAVRELVAQLAAADDQPAR